MLEITTILEAWDAPQECAECTTAFLELLVRRAQELGLLVGESAIT
jgi:hypothetical protein